MWKVWEVPGGLERTRYFFVDQTARPNNKVKMAKERAVRAVVGQRMNLMDTNNRVSEARGREPVRVRAYLGSSSLAGFASCGGTVRVSVLSLYKWSSYVGKSRSSSASSSSCRTSW